MSQSIDPQDGSFEFEPAPQRSFRDLFKRKQKKEKEQEPELLMLPYSTKSVWFGFFVSTWQWFFYVVFVISIVALSVSVMQFVVFFVAVLIIHNFCILYKSKWKNRLFLTLVFTLCEYGLSQVHFLQVFLLVVFVIWYLIHFYRSIFYRLELSESGVTLKVVTGFFQTDSQEFYYRNLAECRVGQNFLENFLNIGDLVLISTDRKEVKIDDVPLIKQIKQTIDDRMALVRKGI